MTARVTLTGGDPVRVKTTVSVAGTGLCEARTFAANARLSRSLRLPGFAAAQFARALPIVTFFCLGFSAIFSRLATARDSLRVAVAVASALHPIRIRTPFASAERLMRLALITPSDALRVVTTGFAGHPSACVPL